MSEQVHYDRGSLETQIKMGSLGEEAKSTLKKIYYND